MIDKVIVNLHVYTTHMAANRKGKQIVHSGSRKEAVNAKDEISGSL